MSSAWGWLVGFAALNFSLAQVLYFGKLFQDQDLRLSTAATPEKADVSRERTSEGLS